eukprot:2561108-Prymnesium_polylepis.1
MATMSVMTWAAAATSAAVNAPRISHTAAMAAAVAARAAVTAGPLRPGSAVAVARAAVSVPT